MTKRVEYSPAALITARSVLAFTLAFFVPALGMAQADVADDPAETVLEEITVTGSRIVTQAVDSPAPVSVYGSDMLLQNTGNFSLGDNLAELPQFAASNRASSVSPTGGGSGTGLNLLDLRGIGTSRTLVLVNGRRHVSSSQNTAQPDINTIPNALIERVEVLTGGASSVYGADAIAGVVNIITKESFDGIEATAQGGISDEGDAESVLVSLTGGINFADDRGNLAASLEYSDSKILYYRDRDFSAVETSIQVPNPLNTDLPGGSHDGIPDFITIHDLRRANASNGGTIGTAAGFMQFNEMGQLVPVDLGTGIIYPGGATEGGSGLNALQDETLNPSLERWSFNLMSSFELNANHALFFEGKYVRTESDVYSLSPFVGFIVQPDNPYLTAQARDTLAATSPAGGAPFFASTRVHQDVGPRGVSNERETIRTVFGLQGVFGERFNYELSYNYGQTDIATQYNNNAILPRIGLSADAVVDVTGVLGSAGAIVCRATLAAGSRSTGNPNIDDCVAGNFLGVNTVSEEARNYINVATRANGKIDQHVFGGFLSTDTAGWFELPGGPVQLVAGAEYRDESTNYTPDPRDLLGDTSNAGQQAVKGDFSVTEWYGEVVAPLLAEVSGAELLELRASVRVADYDLEGVGSNTSWGAGLVYAPIADFRVRGSYQEAVRAPNMAELFTPQALGFSTVLDPCSAFGLSLGGPQRAANCAQVVPPGTPIPIPTFNLPVLQGGNPALDVEEGETLTYGIVITPASIPEFSFSIDYYDIELSNAIFQATVFSNLTLCYDAASLDNPFCDSISRDPVTFQLTGETIAPVNATGFEASGIDFDASYLFSFANDAALNLRLVANKVLERTNYLDPLNPSKKTIVKGTVGNPEWQTYLSADYGTQRWGINYTLRHFSSQLRTDPANVRSVNGQPPLNPDIFGPDVLHTGSQTMHNISGRFSISDSLQVFAGVDNLTEPDLPPGIYGGGFGGANYDPIGRYYYGGVRWSY